MIQSRLIYCTKQSSDKYRSVSVLGAIYTRFNLHLQGESCANENAAANENVASYTSFARCCLYFSEGRFPSHDDFGYR